MTGIVKEIGRSFLVSCFLPAVVFVSLSKQFFFPVFFDNCQPLGFLVHSDFEQTIAMVVVASAFIGYLLWSLNPQLVALFEGYYFQRILRPCKRYHSRRREQMFDEITKLRRQYKAEQEENKRWYLESQFGAKEAELETYYPLYAEDVMPTAIGNVFRAFEQYPGNRYGIDAVLFWPHLASVIPPELARMIEEANNTLTFLLTSCFVCCLLGTESLGAMVKLICCPMTPYVSFLGVPISHLRFYGFFATCAFGAAFALNKGALEASITFGEYVKSCFDFFRRDLLKGMAGEAALKDERRAWNRLRRSILVDKSAWLPEWEAGEETVSEQLFDSGAIEPDEPDRLSWRQQLAEKQGNLRLIEERLAMFVMDNNPANLQLVKRKRELEQEIADLEKRLKTWSPER